MTLRHDRIRIEDTVSAIDGYCESQLVLDGDLDVTGSAETGFVVCDSTGDALIRIEAAGAACCTTRWSPRYGVVEQTKAMRIPAVDGMIVVDIHLS
jgi:hypothetical protein